MTPEQHQAEAERLLVEAKKATNQMMEHGAQPVNDLIATQKTIETAVAMAHVHALLARP